MNKTTEDLQKENFESRVETLTVLFNRLIEKSRNLDGYSATVFTNPMVDMLSMAVMELESYEENKRIDDLINPIINNKK